MKLSIKQKITIEIWISFLKLTYFPYILIFQLKYHYLTTPLTVEKSEYKKNIKKRKPAAIVENTA
jgi:hypothetical protein